MSNFHSLEVVGRGSETQLQVGVKFHYSVKRFKGLEENCVQRSDCISFCGLSFITSKLLYVFQADVIL